MTGFDALAWVMEPKRPPREEPHLPYALTERVAKGECNADGHLQTTSYCNPVRRGKVWLTAEQRDRAAYYGWKETGIVNEPDEGPTLYLVQR